MIGSLDVLQKEVERLKVELVKCQSPLVFCHNDLNHPNLIYNKSDGECVSVWRGETLTLTHHSLNVFPLSWQNTRVTDL